MGSKYSTDFLRALADMKPGRTQLSPYERTRLRDIATELDLAGERATHLQSETDEAWEAYNDVSDREAHLLGVVSRLLEFCRGFQDNSEDIGTKADAWDHARRKALAILDSMESGRHG